MRRVGLKGSCSMKSDFKRIGVVHRFSRRCILHCMPFWLSLTSKALILSVAKLRVEVTPKLSRTVTSRSATLQPVCWNTKLIRLGEATALGLGRRNASSDCPASADLLHCKPGTPRGYPIL